MSEHVRRLSACWLDLRSKEGKERSKTMMMATVGRWGGGQGHRAVLGPFVHKHNTYLDPRTGSTTLPACLQCSICACRLFWHSGSPPNITPLNASHQPPPHKPQTAATNHGAVQDHDHQAEEKGPAWLQCRLGRASGQDQGAGRERMLRKPSSTSPSGVRFSQ